MWLGTLNQNLESTATQFKSRQTLDSLSKQLLLQSDPFLEESFRISMLIERENRSVVNHNKGWEEEEMENLRSLLLAQDAISGEWKTKNIARDDMDSKLLILV
jgi:hypothetical protein